MKRVNNIVVAIVITVIVSLGAINTGSAFMPGAQVMAAEQQATAESSIPPQNTLPGQVPAAVPLNTLTEEQLIQYVLAQTVTPDMDPFQKALAINNYLCMTMTYDDSLTHCSTYDALAYGTGVCQGYANAFKKLMCAAGVPTDYVSGYAWTGEDWGRHGWNRSLINGVYYYTDVTWNDCLEENDYFMISEQQMTNDHDMRAINRERTE